MIVRESGHSASGDARRSAVEFEPGHVAVRAISQEAFESRFQFRRGVRLHDTKGIKAPRAGPFRKRSLNLNWIFQKSRLA